MIIHAFCIKACAPSMSLVAQIKSFIIAISAKISLQKTTTVKLEIIIFTRRNLTKFHLLLLLRKIFIHSNINMHSHDISTHKNLHNTCVCTPYVVVIPHSGIFACMLTWNVLLKSFIECFYLCAYLGSLMISNGIYVGIATTEIT